MYVQRTLRSIRDFQRNTTTSPLGPVHAGVAYLPNVSAGQDISGEVGQGGALSAGQQPAARGKYGIVGSRPHCQFADGS